MKISSTISSIPIIIFGTIAIIKTTKTTGCFEFMEPLIGVLISLLVFLYTIILLILNKRKVKKLDSQFNYVPIFVFVILLVIGVGINTVNHIRFNKEVLFSLELNETNSNEEIHISDYENLDIKLLVNGLYIFTYYNEWEYCRENGKYLIEDNLLILERKGKKIIEYCNFENYKLDTMKMKAYPLDKMNNTNNLQKLSFKGYLHIK